MAGTGGPKAAGTAAGQSSRPGRYPLAALVRHWPAEAREEWEERAAVLEYDAKMTRERAERAAEHIVRDRWDRGLM